MQTIAERLVEYAMVCMQKKNRVSPFERAAAREGMYFRGGVRILSCAVKISPDVNAPLQKEDECVSLSSSTDPLLKPLT